MNTDALKLENQICFPLYACAKELVRQYKPFLDEIGLTYTQYITMMVLWEHRTMNVKKLGEFLYLDSGTMTPLLKKLEASGFVRRSRLLEDERNVIVELTVEGEKLREKAIEIPNKMAQCLPISEDEAKKLYEILYKLLGYMKE